ncbi:DODA-type extradiol aromatic ring-opening family dioxygenase [Magnetospirillum aberrantis]|uniref:Dioxygenase n=1 Tax=Magnetospirillum aberrantis SpK TaxID=908842 RepID=A0A7C9QWF0_9PROT|nr:class III extradiol ring-cleavage dioxygenase [Magnetospirillum aberrantis]NFV80916.1 dioxygenase [Magnetospirillum aberrantis SpK]
MSPMPALFVSHGSPMILVEPSPARDFLTRLADIVPRPRAIVVISAHWTTPAPQVSNSAHPRTIHDFRGFPPELYDLRYDAPGDPELAATIARMSGAEPVEHGLDHGAWVPLLLGWPQADIPVLQLSIQAGEDPTHHYLLGRKLAGLRHDGVLILGSGALTHNLRAYFGDDPLATARNVAFADWMAAKVAKDSTEDLLAYRPRAPEAAFAHPTDEHLLPLFVAMGAGDDGHGRVVHRSQDGCLAMDAYAWE